MYESVIDPPIPVQAGDIVGLVLPENARLSLIFLLNYGSVGGESSRGNDLVDGIPLISLDIGMYIATTPLSFTFAKLTVHVNHIS